MGKFFRVPVAAEGVFACPDQGGGLIGFDAETGERLWQVHRWIPKFDSPIRWMHKGRTYFVVHTTCIEPRTGKVLWRIGGASGAKSTACEDHIVFSGSWRYEHGRGAVPGSGVGLNCFRIRPDGYEKAWALDALHGSGHEGATPLIYAGRVYAQSEEYTPEGKAGKRRNVFCADLQTGKIEGEFQSQHVEIYSSIVGFDGLAVFGTGRTFLLCPAEPKGFAATVPPEKANLPQLGRDGLVTPVLADGRLFARSWVDGRCGMMALDLRKEPGPDRIPHPQRIQGPAATMQGLVRELGSRYAADRATAVEKLRAAGPAAVKGHLPDLLKLMEQGDWRMQAAALDALKALGASAGPQALAVLGRTAQAMLESRRGFASAAMLEAIAAIAPEKHNRAVEAVGRRVRDADEHVARNACFALERLGPSAAPAVPMLIEALKSSRSATVRHAAVSVLEAIGPGAAAAVPALAETLGGNDEDLVIRSAKALRAMGPRASAAVTPLAKAVEQGEAHHPGGPIRRVQSAVEALAAIGPGARPAVAALVDRRFRTAAGWNDVGRAIDEALVAIDPRAAAEALDSWSARQPVNSNRRQEAGNVADRLRKVSSPAFLSDLRKALDDLEKRRGEMTHSERVREVQDRFAGTPLEDEAWARIAHGKPRLPAGL